jgi:hypothetical protein
MRSLSAVVLLLGVLLATRPAAAQQGPTPEEIDRFRSLAPAEREELRRRYRELQKLPPEELAELRRRLQVLRGLSPAERQRVEANHRAFSNLAPAERQRLVELFRKYRNLSPQRQDELRGTLVKVMKMPESARKTFWRNVQRWRQLTPKQKAHLRDVLRRRGR